MTKRISTQKTSKLSSTYNKVTTSVARFFSVAFENILKMFEGGSSQEIMMERFKEWKDEETLTGKKISFQVGQKVVVNNISSLGTYKGFHVGDVAKVVALISEDGVEKLKLFNPKWIAVGEKLELGFVIVDPQECLVEIIGVKKVN